MAQAIIFDLFYTILYDEGTGTREKAIEVAQAARLRCVWVNRDGVAVEDGPEADWTADSLSPAVDIAHGT